jgi:hypothetical protein
MRLPSGAMKTSPHRRAAVAAAMLAVLLLLPSPASAQSTATLVNTVDTSLWVKPSPDPMGLAYKKTTNQLIVVDSEVEEVTGAGFHNANVWITTLAGVVKKTWKTTRFTNEPTDVALQGAKTVFITDDDNAQINVVHAGPDNKWGTADDIVEKFGTKPFGAAHPAGLTFALGDLWLTDRGNATVYRIDPGPNKKFDGVVKGDDAVTHWDTAALGLAEPSDIVFSSASGHFFLVSQTNSVIVETTKAGALVNSYDISGSGIVSPSGIALAPGSSAPAETHVYVSDRGIDNDFVEGGNPNENDGKIFEFSLS